MLSAPLVAVIGSGAIGLACAAELVARRARVLLIAEPRPGEASPAAAGMLAPRVERMTGAAYDFAVLARDRFPAWLAKLEAETGIAVPLLRNGVLDLAPDEANAERLQALGTDAEWLGPDALRALEPALAPAAGALLYEDDGAVDNVAMLEALRQSLSRSRLVRHVTDDVVRISPKRPHAAVITKTSRYEVDRIVLAAGAWVGGIEGVPSPLPVEPVRGQMIAFDSAPLGHVVFAPDAYLVPRGSTTLAGSTMERVGFEVATTETAVSMLHDASAALVPALGHGGVARSWCGLRPITPDMLPVIGADPEHPSLIYACGHSRNGILMAPLTGEAVAALTFREEPPADLSAFAPSRFAAPEAARK